MQLKYMIGNGGRFSCIGGEIFNLNRPWWRTHYYIMCIPGTSQQLLFNYKYPPSAELPSQAKCASTLRGRSCMASAANLVMMGRVGATTAPCHIRENIRETRIRQTLAAALSDKEKRRNSCMLPCKCRYFKRIFPCAAIGAAIWEPVDSNFQSIFEFEICLSALKSNILPQPHQHKSQLSVNRIRLKVSNLNLHRSGGDRSHVPRQRRSQVRAGWRRPGQPSHPGRQGLHTVPVQNHQVHGAALLQW